MDKLIKLNNLGYYISPYGIIIRTGHSSSYIKNGKIVSYKKPDKTISQYNNGKGYMAVNITTTEGTKKFYVHRLVAEKFIPNPNNLKEVNHINGIKSDNRVENLEWCDRKANMQHASKNGLLVNYDKSKINNPNFKTGKYNSINEKSNCKYCGVSMIKILPTNKYCSKLCYHNSRKYLPV